jgi:hypothetical protein
MELLAQELEALDVGGFDLLNLGFDDGELESLLGVGDGDDDLESIDGEDIEENGDDNDNVCPHCGGVI